MKDSLIICAEGKLSIWKEDKDGCVLFEITGVEISGYVSTLLKVEEQGYAFYDDLAFREEILGTFHTWYWDNGLYKYL